MKNLAIEFSKVLNQWLTSEQLAEINRLNKTPEYQDGSCATHNYCDANQAMIDAFATLYNRQPDVQCDRDNSLIDGAWSLARYHNFNPSAIRFPLLNTIAKESPGTVVDSNWFDILEEEGRKFTIKELQEITSLPSSEQILAEHEGDTVEELLDMFNTKYLL